MTNELQMVAAPRESLYPFADFDELFDDLHARLFAPFGLLVAGGRTLGDGSPDTRTLPRALRVAPLDVIDSGKSYKLSAEIPGIPKDKLEIRVKGTRVEIQGEATQSSESDSAGFVHRERKHVGFYRAVELPEAVKAAEAKATVHDGILELELPKVEPTPSPDEVKVPVQ
ncbi:MAG TPA: Hsp20/alpha crystallin family protein [Thermoplasmata archaeon]|nr:Hsp20/alpha crystallin family protein [Thermoplasmata archaeon]